MRVPSVGSAVSVVAETAGVRSGSLSPEAEELAGRVVDALGEPERLGIAFSGGVDSAVLLALAVRALGPSRTLAILGVSASLAASERRIAHEVAAVVGAPLVEVETRETSLPAYRANGPDRCFHCKDELFTRISDEVAAQYGVTAIAYGENAEDALRPDRPGAQAATAHAVLRPLATAGLGKAEVRSLARELGLPVADKPAAPCLASRIPHFEEVTPRKLRQIEAAEAAVREFGFADVRVRHHGSLARIELAVADLPRAFDGERRQELLAAVKAAGFDFVALDLAGIQSGAFTLPLVVRHD